MYVKLVTSQANLAFTLVSTHTGFVTLNKAVGHSLTEPSVDLCLYICVTDTVTVKIKGDMFIIHLAPYLTQTKDSINVSFSSY